LFHIFNYTIRNVEYEKHESQRNAESEMSEESILWTHALLAW